MGGGGTVTSRASAGPEPVHPGRCGPRTLGCAARQRSASRRSWRSARGTPPPMLNQPEPACPATSDISGYTGSLAGAELNHAQDILAGLKATVVGALRPTSKPAKLEGDAAFVYLLA